MALTMELAQRRCGEGVEAAALVGRAVGAFARVTPPADIRRPGACEVFWFDISASAASAVTLIEGAPRASVTSMRTVWPLPGGRLTALVAVLAPAGQVDEFG
jgi:hypothetical protein